MRKVKITGLPKAQSGMEDVNSTTKDTASGIQKSMGDSLKSVQASFQTTEIEATTVAGTMSQSWSNSSINMASATVGAVDSINSSLSQIPTKITTVHEIVEVTSRGSSSGQTGGTTYATGPTPISLPSAFPVPKSSSSSSSSGGSWLGNTIGAIGKWLGFASGGVVPGRLGSPMPAIVHGGERVIPVGGSNEESGITLNVTYSINVSDKFQMEKMIKSNNTKLVEDLRRMINT
jgi:hypothetical protein